MRIRRPKRVDVYVQSLVVRSGETGLQEVHVCLGSDDIGQLKEAMQSAFQSTIERHLSSPDFGGDIVIVILGEITPQTPGLWRAVTEVEEQLKATIAAAQLRTTAGRPVNVRVTYTSRQEA